MNQILVHEWINSTKKSEGSPDAGSGDWSIQRVIDMSLDGRWEEIWEFIVSVSEQADSDWVLTCLGAGPLEDLLCSSCPDFIERVAIQTGRSKAFKRALCSVWLDGADTPFYKEVYKIAGIDPPFD